MNRMSLGELPWPSSGEGTATQSTVCRTGKTLKMTTGAFTCEEAQTAQRLEESPGCRCVTSAPLIRMINKAHNTAIQRRPSGAPAFSV